MEKCLHDVCNGRQAVRHTADVEAIFDCLLERKIIRITSSGKIRTIKGGSNAASVMKG
jgi:hypothetical protein